MQALIKGEVDFVEDITALEVKALQGEPGITAHNGNSPGFEEIAFNTGSVDTQDRQADRRPQPGGARPEVPARARLRAEPAAADPEGLPGRRPARDDDRPADLHRLALGAAGRPEVHLRPRQGRASCSTRRATRRGPTASARCRTASRSAPCGWPRAVRLADVAATRWTTSRSGSADLGIKSQVLDLQLEPAHRRDPQGQLRRLPVGLVRRARPRLDAQLHDLRPARQLVGLVVLQQAVRHALQRSSTCETDQAKRVEADQEDAGDRSTSDSPYLVTAYSTDRRGRPQRPVRLLRQPQPNPGGVWLEQYGVYNYIHMQAGRRGRRPATACTAALTGAVKVVVEQRVARHSTGPFLIVVGAVVVVAPRRRRCAC